MGSPILMLVEFKRKRYGEKEKNEEKRYFPVYGHVNFRFKI
jgi:hypothetical protein